ncbi:MAG: NAD(P)/FAD-dependent oxidoreductase [Salana multivorans]|uniref:NAD(P)/FAD-dependent oxidoreductase n=1 Tax=Salana multivorans TaxID=120377 RepID=UPI0009642B0E|nr:NAD(P)/FAD-dependent oxidoreductase [Salana multivorans]MBN8883453.1 NAD(P)/FAD-dependent oxidoreductase [Salana multivorans]OJX94023.1 MAG: oxidoreductase [Micrococcales bacterium 73-15]
MSTSADPGAPWDAIVIGGGAAGLSAALLLGRARRRVLVVDAGSPRNRFADHMHGVLGNEGTPPADLLLRGRSEVADYGVELRDGAVETVRDEGTRLAVTLADGGVELARALVVATGLTDELPDLPGLAERWGTSVLHCPYCHGWEVRDERIGILATSPMALHQARLVRQWSDRVTLLAGALGPLDPGEEARLRSRGVEVVAEPVVEVLGDGPRVTGVRTADGRVVELDAIFTAGAPRPHDAFLADLRLARADLPFGLGSFLAVDPTGRTSHERVWAVGNVVNPMANVPMAIGAGAFTGGAVNGALVEEDFDLAGAAREGAGS